MSSHIDHDGPHGARATRALQRSLVAAKLYWLVLAAILGGIAYLLAITVGPSLLPSGKVDITIAPPEMPGQAVSYDSEIKGTDEEQKPYHIQATRGFQDATNKDIYHLETFRGTFTKATGAELNVTSKTGVYDSNAKILDLSGSVEILDAAKFTARMDKAQFDVEKRSLTSQSPVQVTLPNGDIQADSLVSENNGERMLFRGRVKANFTRSGSAQGGTP